jgi:Spy/CpxP family protein refolding chaperone
MSDNRVRVWFSLFVLVVFCVGLAGGVLIGRRMPVERPVDRVLRGPREFPPGAMGEGRRGGPLRGLLVERLARELDLTSDQRAKIDAILTDGRSRLETLQRDARQRFEDEGRGLREQIRSVLTPEQQKTFDQKETLGKGPFGRRGPPR